MKKSLYSDLNGCLNEVSRGYIRKPLTILISIILLIISTPIGICYTWKMCWREYIVPTWKGLEYKH